MRPSLTARSKVAYCSIIRGRLTDQAMVIFRNTPFGPWLDLTMECGDAMLVTCFLQREVSVSGAEPEELNYSIDGYVRRFGREEFMLITGLPFGLLPDHSYVYGNALISRLFPASVPPQPSQGEAFRVLIRDVVRMWNNNFDDLDDYDKVRVALIIMVELVFLGRQPHQYVSPEVVRAVEDMDRFSEYPWGSFVWTFTYRQMKGAFSRRNEVSNKISLSGFLLAFNIWILEMFPVSSKCFSRMDRHPRGIRWERKVRTMQKDDVNAFLSVPKRLRRPRERLVADAFELHQLWYIGSMAWFQNPLSIRPPKRVRRAPIDPGDPSDDDDDDDDGGDGGGGNQGGIGGGGGDQGGVGGIGEERPEVRPQLQMAGTSCPSSSANPPLSSQDMPKKLRETLNEYEAKIKKLNEVFKAKEVEKRAFETSIADKKEIIKSTKKGIRKDERAINLIKEEFAAIEDELRDKYCFIGQIKAIYPD